MQDTAFSWQHLPCFPTELTDISRVECFCSLVPGSSILPPLKCRCDCVNVEVLKKKQRNNPVFTTPMFPPVPQLFRSCFVYTYKTALLVFYVDIDKDVFPAT